jgi:maltose O-acetyltransferase
MTTEREKMQRGERYDPSDPELTADRRDAREMLRAYNRTAPDASEHRSRLLAELFGSVGEECHIEPPFRCDYGYNIHVGDHFYANFDCVLLDVCPVRIGDHCSLGPGVHVYTATHALDPEMRSGPREHGMPVEIGDRVWIGGRAVVNPGVAIGDDAVVASGAVVTADVPAGTLVGGNPAEVVREVETGPQSER